MIAIHGGVRLSHAKQVRSNFKSYGVPVEATAVEKIRTWSLILGIRGDIDITKQLHWNYKAEYFHPLEVEMTNNYLPGFKSTDKGGFGYEGGVGVKYFHADRSSFSFNVYGGKIHWDGSGLIPYESGIARWPENDTHYLGCLLEANLQY